MESNNPCQRRESRECFSITVHLSIQYNGQTGNKTPYIFIIVKMKSGHKTVNNQGHNCSPSLYICLHTVKWTSDEGRKNTVTQKLFDQRYPVPLKSLARRLVPYVHDNKSVTSIPLGLKRQVISSLYIF